MYIIYGRNNCDYCNKAKSLLDLKGLPYTYHLVGDGLDEFSKEELVEICSSFEVVPRSVPQIFLSPGFEYGMESWTYIGGYNDLVEETI